MEKTVTVNNTCFANNQKLSLIAGPCVLQSKSQALEIATELKTICDKYGIDYVFKASFDKANRTSATSARGIGISQSLEIFESIENSGITTTTDVHEAAQCEAVAKTVSILQIPAMLSRQTDLLMAAGKHARGAVNIKKGQFMSPDDILFAADKVKSSGCDRVLLTERGVTFGYKTLVNDMRALKIMAQNGDPVIFDATHSVQQPSAAGGKSTGQREFVPMLARAAVAVGVAGLFIETHPNPDQSPSDGDNMIPLNEVDGLIATLCQIDAIIKALPTN